MRAATSLTWRHSTIASCAGSQYDSNSGIGDSTCMPMPIASICSSRCSTSQHSCETLRNTLPSIMTLRWLHCDDAAIEGQDLPPPAPGNGGRSYGTMWVWMSIETALMLLPRSCAANRHLPHRAAPSRLLTCAGRACPPAVDRLRQLRQRAGHAGRELRELLHTEAV